MTPPEKRCSPVRTESSSSQIHRTAKRSATSRASTTWRKTPAGWGSISLDFEHLPLVVQFNKRDLADITREEEVLARWAPTGLKLTFSSALNGQGVLGTFRLLLDETYTYLDEVYALNKHYGITAAHFAAVLPEPIF
jgi:hypothetical protein